MKYILNLKLVLLIVVSLQFIFIPNVGYSQNVEKSRPNILIYVADDQYISSVGCYGAEPSHTPNIDKLAEQGLRFTNCFTPSSICTPNRGVILSGMYPLKNGAHPNHSGFYNGVKSMPNYMKEIGYRACIVGKDGIQKPSDLYEWEFRIKKSDEQVPGADEPKHDRHKKSRFDKIEKFISSDDSRPFCIVHAASLPHSPLLNKLPNGLEGYDANNYYMDFELGKYLDLLNTYNLKDNTIVIYVNDNEAQLKRTKNTLYDTGIHVPMVIRWPGQINPGTTANTIVSTLDLLPTLLEVACGEIPDVLDGKSMLGVWEGKTAPLHEQLFFSYSGVIVSTKRQETPYPIRAVRTDRYKYIRYINHDVGHPKFNNKIFPAEELFDLQTDPEEKNNLAESPECAEIKKQLSNEVDQWMKAMNDNGIESEEEALRRYPAKQTKKEKK
jgi:N-sulfoglucosamine sulfohydrolase